MSPSYLEAIGLMFIAMVVPMLFAIVLSNWPWRGWAFLVFTSGCAIWDAAWASLIAANDSGSVVFPYAVCGHFFLAAMLFVRGCREPLESDVAELVRGH